MSVTPPVQRMEITVLRNKRYQQLPKLGHYIRLDESGEMHVLFDNKKKDEWDREATKKYLKKIKEQIQEKIKK